MQIVRNAVKENVLSDPALVPDADVEIYITKRGKGWVCIYEKQLIGFSIADLQDDNIWALFVLPEFEGQGIGNRLHQLMLDWYFEQGKQEVWLSTEVNSRANRFYKLKGWLDAGLTSKGEQKFVLSALEWKRGKSSD